MTVTQQALSKLQPPPGAPSSAWATRISACWQASFKAILEVGRLLAEAKAALPHGEFGHMIERDLPFSSSTANRLMTIAADERISNPAHVQHMPTSWGTLYEITKLDDAQFEQKIKDGTIKPDMMRRDIAEDVPPEPDRTQMPANDRVVAPRRVEPKDSRDYAPTPPWATRVLATIVFPQIGVDLSKCTAHEPACGEGHIAEVLREFTDCVTASDLHEYGYGVPGVDYLEGQPIAEVGTADWVITNPPFNKAEEFTLKAIALAEQGVAMFVRWQWIEGVGRYERLFNAFPPTMVCPFAERVPLHMGRWEPEGDTMTAYCWVVWHMPLSSAKASTRLFWIPPGQRKALTQVDDAERFTTHPVTKRRSTFADDGSPTDQQTGEIIDTREAGE